MVFELKALPYGFDALEPYMDAKTVEIHWGKHHQGYVNKLNVALQGKEELSDRGAVWILENLNEIPDDIRTAVKNNCGGMINHDMFWEILSGEKQECFGKILEKINEDFGSFEDFKKEFTEKSVGFFGSGWCWLVLSDGKLEIITTGDHDSPLSLGKKPLLVIDLWEHAYYLKHQNRRNEFVDNFWKLVNWGRVEELLG
ncbi:MAG: superoxide dismutase [Candidatus Pacearchaeota archaeon]|nr:superoxide dismutase [Candidatus Pacearchaeota archaeon]